MTATQWSKAEERSDAADTSLGPRWPPRGNLSVDEEDWHDLGKVATRADGTHTELRDIDAVMEQSDSMAPASDAAFKHGDVELADAPEGPDQAVKSTATDEDDFEMEVDNSMGILTAGSRWWGEGTFNPSLRAFPSGDYGSN